MSEVGLLICLQFVKALENFKIDRRSWPALAADRAAWRSTLLNDAIPRDAFGRA